MTSLLFFTDADEALVVTDTLVADPDENFLYHANKAAALPSRNMIIAGTGAAEVYLRWMRLVDDQSGAMDIDSLNIHAPQRLQAIWAEVRDEIPVLAEQTATIYHFGFANQRRGDIHAYAYRSENGFSSERLAYGLALKPAMSVKDLEGINYADFPAQSPAIMRRQAKIEAAKPKGVRVLIGGNVKAVHLNRSGFTLYTIGSL